MTSEPPHAVPTQKAGFKRHIPTIARVFLGLILTIFGVLGLFNLIPEPKMQLPAAAIAFNTGLMQAGYMMPLIFLTQLVSGLMLLTNRFVPLGLTLLAPFIVNSFLFHLFLVRDGLPMIAVIAAIEIYLAWCYRKAFAPMLAMKVAVD